MCALNAKIILIYQNEAIGSQSIVLYTKASISRFICHSGGRFLAPQTTFPFPDWFSSSSVFINFSLFYGAGFHQIIPAALYPMV